MPCYHPLPAWYSRQRTPTGKRGITFRRDEAWTDMQLELPCGTCIGCKLERARQWALRCMHEAQQHQENAFVTLTYDNDSVSTTGTLVPEHFVLFMKRLRKKHDGVRFFQCGEYGEALSRPHHHALLFNCSFLDRRVYPGGRTRHQLWTSDELDQLWGHGRTIIGSADYDAAAYVARYSLKKVSGPAADSYYQGRIPEYCTMSRRPGIGYSWLQQYHHDVYPDDSVTLRGGIQVRPPRYYDNRLEAERPTLHKRIKARRRAQQTDDPDATGKRLIVRERVKAAAMKLTHRNYEAPR